MGWWLVDSDGKVGEFEGRECQNAIPGEDSPDGRYGGDIPADIMGDAVKRIRAEYLPVWGREPYPEELRHLVEFAMGA